MHLAGGFLRLPATCCKRTSKPASILALTAIPGLSTVPASRNGWRRRDHPSGDAEGVSPQKLSGKRTAPSSGSLERRPGHLPGGLAEGRSPADHNLSGKRTEGAKTAPCLRAGCPAEFKGQAPAVSHRPAPADPRPLANPHPVTGLDASRRLMAGSRTVSLHKA